MAPTARTQRGVADQLMGAVGERAAGRGVGAIAHAPVDPDATFVDFPQASSDPEATLVDSDATLVDVDATLVDAGVPRVDRFSPPPSGQTLRRSQPAFPRPPAPFAPR